MENTVLSVCLPFATYFTLQDESTARIDNFPDRLHYKFTTGFLFLATAILSMDKQWGDNIQCGNTNGKAHRAVTQYCWVTGTFTVPKRVYNETCQDDDNEDGCHDVFNYYQWVPYVLVLMGLLFLLPNQLWKYLEEEKIDSIVKGIKDQQNKAEDREQYLKHRKIVVKNVAKFIVKHNNNRSHQKYAMSFMLCQILNILNVVINFLLTDLFLDWKFGNLGKKWLEDLFERINNGETMISSEGVNDIFPRLTSCVWHQKGTGAKEEKEYYLCLLATNRITEKIFVFYWFWLIFLAIISTLSFIYYCTLFYKKSPRWRDRFLAIAINDTKMARSKGKMTKKEMVQKYLADMPATQFFFFYLVGLNVDYETLGDLSDEIYDLQNKPSESQQQTIQDVKSESLHEDNVGGNETLPPYSRWKVTLDALKLDQKPGASAETEV